jgi:hypothetical protein
MFTFLHQYLAAKILGIDMIDDKRYAGSSSAVEQMDTLSGNPYGDNTGRQGEIGEQMNSRRSADDQRVLSEPAFGFTSD